MTEDVRYRFSCGRCGHIQYLREEQVPFGPDGSVPDETDLSCGVCEVAGYVPAIGIPQPHTYTGIDRPDRGAIRAPKYF